MIKTLKTSAICTLLVACSLLAAITLIPEIAMALSGTYNSRATANALNVGGGTLTVTNPTRAYDGDNATNALTAYARGAGFNGPGNFELKSYGPTAGAPRGSIITSVDFKVWYKSTLSSSNAVYKISYWVDPSATETILKGPVRDSGSWNLTWTSQPEPNNAVWNWTDVSNIRFRWTTDDSSGADTGGTLQIYECWMKVYYTVPEVHVNPKTQSPTPTAVKVNVTKVDELYGFEYKLRYNASVVTATTISLGPFLNTTAGGTANTYGRIIQKDNVAGLVWATQTIIGDRKGGYVASGSWGQLATVNFAVVGSGSSNIELEVKLAGYNYVGKKTYPIDKITVGPSHDVAVTLVEAAPTDVTRGDLVTVNVTVQNQGYYSETFLVSAYAGGTLIDTQVVTGLAIGTSTKKTFTWDTRIYSAGNYLTTGIATITSGFDADSADNSGTGPAITLNNIFGDINEDGWVDAFDIERMNFAWGASYGNYNWLPAADLNEDNIINVYDLRLLGRAWQPSP